jgi:ATP-dependent Clp protease ATP-binding subunit ClpA
VVTRVVEKFILQLEAQLEDRHVTFEISPEANAWLVKNGYDEQMGARPMSRIIQEHIKKPIAEELLFGKLKKGGVVKVTVDKEGKLAFEILEAEPRPPVQDDEGEGTETREPELAG